jgi:hypothetical protein
MYSLYKNEYRIFKPAEITISRELREKEENRRDEPIWIIMHTWKCHKETSCIASYLSSPMLLIFIFFIVVLGGGTL